MLFLIRFYVMSMYLFSCIATLAECPQCYFGEIRQMLTFLIDTYCPKAYHMPDHSIRIVEYHRKHIISKRNIFTETRIQENFRGYDRSSCNLLTETINIVFCAILLSCLIRASEILFIRTRAQDIFLGFWSLLL
jgi:hypothetical protein